MARLLTLVFSFPQFICYSNVITVKNIEELDNANKNAKPEIPLFYKMENGKM
jgi:hypothetical protein